MPVLLGWRRGGSGGANGVGAPLTAGAACGAGVACIGGAVIVAAGAAGADIGAGAAAGAGISAAGCGVPRGWRWRAAGAACGMPALGWAAPATGMGMQ
jgi:hypothetical protein